ncbi:hypothetical protein [Streptomyces hypolithicus]
MFDKKSSIAAQEGVPIGRFADGKPVERWGGSDQLGTMTQFGHM